MSSSIKKIRWRVFIPIFMLFFSYIFGVAVEVLGAYQLYIRALVVLFCIAFGLFLNVRISVPGVVLFTLFLIYLSSLYFLRGGPIVLNFIYLAVILFYLDALKISREELLHCSLFASFAVIFLYIIYLCFFGVELGPVIIGNRARYYFGFTNPNKVGVVCYSLIVLSILFFYRRNFLVVLVLCVPFLILSIYSDSRTSIYSVVFFLGLAVFPFLLRFRRLVFLVPIALMVCSFYLATINSSDLANSLLSNRPIDFYEFIRGLFYYNYIFGASSDGYRVDNSYILAYFAVGPLGVLVFLFFLYRYSREVSNKLEFSFVISLMAYGLMEGVLVRVEFPVVIYFYYILLNGGESVFCRVKR